MKMESPPNYNSISSSPTRLVIEDTGAKEDNDIPPRRRRCFRWIPTSMAEFEANENQAMAYIKLPQETKFVSAGQVLEPKSFCIAPKLVTVQISTTIITPPVPPPEPKLPIVLFHGICLAKATWIVLANELGKHRTLFAMDLPGYGRSSRVKFPKDATQAEETYLKILESWRESLAIDKFILVGYSFGGFLATSYALQYPKRVSQLLLLDPWGYPEKPEILSNLVGETNPVVIRIMEMYMKWFNISAPIGLVGPLGPALNNFLLKDAYEGFKTLGDDIYQIVRIYGFHCTAKKLSGERAFRSMLKWVAFAKNPLCRRIHLLNPDIPVKFFIPETSYVPSIPEDGLRTLFNPQCKMTLHKIPSITHDTIAISDETANLLGSIVALPD